MRDRGKVLWLWLALFVAGCGGGGSQSGDVGGTQWLRGIDLLAAELQRLHPDLFHSVSRQEFDLAVAALKRDAPGRSAVQNFLAIKRLVALPAMREDGHMTVPMFQGTGFRLFPLRLYEFSEGVFVIDANDPHRDAIGKQVVQIGGVDIAEVNRRLDPFIARDNPTTVVFKRTLHYVVPEFLQALGVLADAQVGDYLLRDANGDFTDLVVAPIEAETYRTTLQNTIGLPGAPAPMWLSDPEENFWLRVIDTDTLYVRYRLVQGQTNSGLTLRQFAERIAAEVAGGAIDKVIVDVRHNGGGNNATFGPLVDVLASAAIDRPGALYVLIDRLTFSAAANFVTVMEQRTGAVFAGETTGGSRNNYGDTIPVTLPNSGFGVSIPSIYWEFSPGDARLGIEPTLPVALSAQAYFAAADPVLEAVLAR